MQPNTWKYFPFPEISISRKYVFSGKRFTATKHSLSFKCIIIYDILSPHCASLHIPFVSHSITQLYHILVEPTACTDRAPHQEEKKGFHTVVKLEVNSKKPICVRVYQGGKETHLYFSFCNSTLSHYILVGGNWEGSPSVFLILYNSTLLHIDGAHSLHRSGPTQRRKKCFHIVVKLEVNS